MPALDQRSLGEMDPLTPVSKHTALPPEDSPDGAGSFSSMTRWRLRERY